MTNSHDKKSSFEHDDDVVIIIIIIPINSHQIFLLKNDFFDDQIKRAVIKYEYKICFFTEAKIRNLKSLYVTVCTSEPAEQKHLSACSDGHFWWKVFLRRPMPSQRSSRKRKLSRGGHRGLFLWKGW